MEAQSLKFSRKSLFKKKKISERSCHHVEKINKKGWGRVHTKQKKKYYCACFPVRESLESAMLHFKVSYKCAWFLSLPSSVQAAFQMRTCGKAQCLSFMLVREVSQMSETDNWEQGQQILGTWYVVRFLGNSAKEIIIGLIEKKSTQCVLNNVLAVLLRYGRGGWIQQSLSWCNSHEFLWKFYLMENAD